MPDYGPHEDSYTLFLEKTFLGGNFVAGVGYGVQLVLYISCVLYLWRQRKRRGWIMIFLLVYISVLLTLESTFVSAGTWTVEDMYINNRNYPGGPWVYFLATQNLPENVLFVTSLFILTFLSDLLVLWRCWVIWNISGRRVAYAVITFPTIVLLTSFALGTIWALQSSQPGLSLYSSVPIAFGTAYYVTSLSVNILVTILIILRLLLHRRTVLVSLPPEHAEHYLSVATIVVESAALYSAFALAFIVSYAINNPINQIFMSLGSSCQQIAGYLIILRVAQGRAWSPTTLSKTVTSEPQLTTVQFSMPTTSSQMDSDVEAQGDHFSNRSSAAKRYGLSDTQKSPHKKY